jgi:competence protein ComEC
MRAVALLPAIAIVAGASLGLAAGAPPHATTLVALVAWVAAVVGWWCHRTQLTVGALLAGYLASALVLTAAARAETLRPSLRSVLDAEYGHFVIDTAPPGSPHGPLRLRAVLTEDAAMNADGASLRASAVALFLRGAWQPVKGGLVITVAGTSLSDRLVAWRAGRAIDAAAVFRRPATYLDDGVPDFERDLALDGTTLFASVKSGLLVDVVSKGSAAEELAADARAAVRAAVARWVGRHDPVAAAIVTAVLIGDRTGLPDDVRERLQAAGTYHVIAISGGNIAILAVLTMALLAMTCVRGRLAVICTIVVLLVYANVVAAGPSVWRATLMAVLYLAARAIDHRTPPWHATAVAVAVMVLWRPLDVRDAGFVLTFGATAALIETARRSQGRLAGHRVTVWIAASIVASVATELVLLPVSASWFSRVTMAGVALNLMAIPAMAVVQIAGMIVVAAGAVASVAAPAGWVAYAGAHLLVESARLVDIAPSLSARVPPPPGPVLVAYYAALAACLWGRDRILRVISGSVVAMMALAIVSGATVTSTREAGLRWTIFDVGQGESMLLQTASESLLIDAGGAPFGGSFDIGGRVLAPALWARGVRRLHALLVTHGDPDHIGGAPVAADIFRPSGLWLGVPVPRHVPTRELIARAGRSGASAAERRQGETFAFGEARIRVLHPPAPDWERQRVRNDDSVVLEVTYGDVALLLIGDIGADVERTLIPQLTPARVRILKVAHHGSRTSTSRELLEAWRPQSAVISCGRGNTFGHPAPEVIARLEAIGARIYRTDRDGEVTVWTDGHSVSVRTFVGGK